MPESSLLSASPSPVPSVDGELRHSQQRALSPAVVPPEKTLDVSATCTTLYSTYVPVVTTTVSESSQYISTAVSSSTTTTTTIASCKSSDKLNVSTDSKSASKLNAWSHDSGGSFASVAASVSSTHVEERHYTPVRPSSSLSSTVRPVPQEGEFVEDIESTTDFPPLARSHSDPQMVSEDPVKDNKDNMKEAQSPTLQMSKFPMTKINKLPPYSPTVPSIEAVSPEKTEQSSSGPPSDKLPFSSPESDEAEDVTDERSHTPFRTPSKNEGQVVGLTVVPEGGGGGKQRQVGNEWWVTTMSMNMSNIKLIM